MPPPKATKQSIVDALNDFSLQMGAELTNARLQIETLTAQVQALTAAVSALSGMALTAPKATEGTLYAWPLINAEKTLIEEGHLIAAIKAYRARVQTLTGQFPGLKESKDLMEGYKHMLQSTKPAFNSKDPLPLLDEHKLMIQEGEKLEAIKAYRTYTILVCSVGAGLKEAKDVCDAYAAAYG